MALTRAWRASPNYSSRGGARVRLIVIHSSEGAQTWQSLGNYFASRASQVSSHTGIDNAAGNTIGEYVKPASKAWTAGNANPVAIQTELCTPSGASARWNDAEWRRHGNMLRKCAAWVAEEAKRYGIPITKLTAAQAQGSGRGVVQHKDLGTWGGGHVDCGPGFPMDYVLQLARGGTQPGTGGGITAWEAGDRMTPSIWWNSKDSRLYRAMRGSDGLIYYMGPDTNEKWQAVAKNTNCASGVTITGNPGNGRLWIEYVNTGGSVCTYVRDPGAKNWQWSSQGGKAK
ncbi:MAG: N-acetylmuramoyl-L-alanine amidase [Kitasatospora sp.]|jgi:hypothetical protein|nr:N-acetylmuramoyl-L-alanine amidase [Kitasatospora sp.]